MNLIRFLGRCAILSLFLAAVPAFATDYCQDACIGMLQEGRVLESQGKYQEALGKFRAAHEPLASLPVSSEAALLVGLSGRVKPEQATAMRDAARGLAHRALRLSADDPIAQETLRMLDDGDVSPLRKLAPEAARLMAEAEALFVQQHYPEALKKYEAVMQADPQYSGAWVGAGDCYFMQKDWPQAETLFRQATEIEPRNSAAWRYLADALVHQHKGAAAEGALLSGVEADPSQRPNWNRLSMLRANGGAPLQSLALRRHARAVPDSSGKYTINIDDASLKDEDSADLGVHMALATAEVMKSTLDKAVGKTTSPYAVELAAWRNALKVADEMKADGGKDVRDPALRKMLALARDDQLEPAVLLLLFRQSYRPDLDAWLAAHPGGVKAFIDRYGLQP